MKDWDCGITTQLKAKEKAWMASKTRVTIYETALATCLFSPKWNPKLNGIKSTQSTKAFYSVHKQSKSCDYLHSNLSCGNQSCSYRGDGLVKPFSMLLAANTVHFLVLFISTCFTKHIARKKLRIVIYAIRCSLNKSFSLVVVFHSNKLRIGRKEQEKEAAKRVSLYTHCEPRSRFYARFYGIDLWSGFTFYPTLPKL